MKVGHYQCECRSGDYPANIATVVHGLEFARRERVDIMCFPESFLTECFITATVRFDNEADHLRLSRRNERINRQWPITNCQLPIGRWQLPIGYSAVAG